MLAHLDLRGEEGIHIRHEPTLDCPFLSAERLCSIQVEHGTEYMPAVCQTYPRVSRRIDGLPETALLLSCPEAARQVLLNPKLIPRKNVVGAGDRYCEVRQVVDPDVRTRLAPHQYLWEIRGFTLLLLQDRSFPLWQRMFVLGIFCNQLAELTAAGAIGLTPKLLRDYSELITRQTLHPTMNSIGDQSEAQLSLIVRVVRHYLQAGHPGNVRFLECVDDFLNGVGCQTDNAPGDHAGAYAEAYSRHYRPFMEDHPFLLENYLINYVFRSRFPYGVDFHGEANDPRTDFLWMCLQFAVIKGMLIGMAARYREQFTTRHVVKLVQSFSRTMEHAPQILERVMQGLRVNDPGLMAVLLRN